LNKKILLADRSSSHERVFVEALAGEAIDITAVTDGYAAERSLNDTTPDLVFADVFLLGKNGYELCRSIKQDPRLSSLPVVLLVGAFEPFDAAEAARAGADGKIAKPIEATGLVEIVRKLTGSAVLAAADVRDPVLTAIPSQAPEAESPYGSPDPTSPVPPSTQPEASQAQDSTALAQAIADGPPCEASRTHLERTTATTQPLRRLRRAPGRVGPISLSRRTARNIAGSASCWFCRAERLCCCCSLISRRPGLRRGRGRLRRLR
jgi:CheY-like chemotaxis protein